jgi:hypothetical protein
MDKKQLSLLHNLIEDSGRIPSLRIMRCGAQDSHKGSHYYIVHMSPCTRIPNWRRCICEGWSKDCKPATLHFPVSAWAIYWTPDLIALSSPSRLITGFGSGMGTRILKYTVFAIDALRCLYHHPHHRNIHFTLSRLQQQLIRCVPDTIKLMKFES